MAVKTEGPGSSIFVPHHQPGDKDVTGGKNCLGGDDCLCSVGTKETTCQWMDLSKIVNGSNPCFVQQLLTEVLLSLMTTVMGSGRISTTPTKMLKLPGTHIFAPPSISNDKVSDLQIWMVDWLSRWRPKTCAHPNTQTTLLETEGGVGSSAKEDYLMALEWRLNGKLKGLDGEGGRTWSWMR
jgi:hypothetical protein